MEDCPVMASDTVHYTGWGVVLTAAGWLWNLAKKEARRVAKSEGDVPSVREWRLSKRAMTDAIEAMESGMRNLKVLIDGMDLPGMLKAQAAQGASIRAVETSQIGIRADISELRRTCDRHEEQIENLERKVSSMPHNIGPRLSK